MARQSSTTARGGGFDEKTIEAVWLKGTPEPGLDSFRKDICGASMQRSKYGKTEAWGWEIDHIKPVSTGGNRRPEQPTAAAVGKQSTQR